MFLPVINVEISNPMSLLGTITITDLGMSFTISKTSGKEENILTLQIYNLNPDNRKKLSNENSTIILRAGYSDEVPLSISFKGDVCFSQNSIQKPNVITTIEALDGNKLLRNTKVSYAFKSGSTAKQILNFLIKEYGLKIRSDVDLLPIIDKQYLAGSTYNGTLFKALESICQDLNLEWSIQNGLLTCWDKNKSSSLKGRVYLNKNTGLIGSPEEIKIKEEKKSEGDKDTFRKGWSIQSLLISTIEPGSIVEVESEVFPGKKVLHTLDVNHSGSNLPGGINNTQFTSEVYNE